MKTGGMRQTVVALRVSEQRFFKLGQTGMDEVKEVTGCDILTYWNVDNVIFR